MNPHSRADAGFFTAATAAKITHVPLSTMNYWARTGVITPSQRTLRPRMYSFADLRDLRVAQELRDAGAKAGEIKAVVSYIRALSGEQRERLAQAEVAVVGSAVVYRNRALGIEPVQPSLHGQRVASVSMAKIFQDLGADETTDFRELRPADRVLVDPEVQGGAPVIDGTRIPTELIAAFVEDGASIEDIVEIYPSLEPADIEAASAWEAQSSAATG